MPQALAASDSNIWDERILRPEQVQRDQLLWIKVYMAMWIVEGPAIITAVYEESFILRMLDGSERCFRFKKSLPEDSHSNRNRVWVVDSDVIAAYLKQKEQALERVVEETNRAVWAARRSLKKFRALRKQVKL